MKSEAEEVAQATAEHRVNVPDADLAIGELERAEGAPATRVNEMNGTDAVRGNRNIGGRAVSRNLMRRILYHAGPVILTISAVLLISIPLGLQFRLQVFFGFCGIFVGMMLVFLAVYLS